MSFRELSISSEEKAMLSKTVVVSTGDSSYFETFCDMVASLRQFEAFAELPVVLFDLGMSPEQAAELESDGIKLIKPDWPFGYKAGDLPDFHLGAIARPYMREYVPGYTYYMWFDSDLWIQDPNSLLRYLHGADQKNLSVVAENDKAYRFQWWLTAWTIKHSILGSGPYGGLRILTGPQLNIGALCLHVDAPHWKPWLHCFENAIKRRKIFMPYEQFTLIEAIARNSIDTAILENIDNWICDRGPPVYDEEQGVFFHPEVQNKPLGIVHLAGPGKKTAYDIKTIQGSVKKMTLHLPGGRASAKFYSK